MAAPRLIVGLGNPGAEYADSRHNAGFWLCERLAAQLGTELRRESRFHGIAGRTREQLWLLMPQTFMNCSGQAVGALMRFYRISPAEMLVLHDELDLSPGALRLKFGGGLGGVVWCVRSRKGDAHRSSHPECRGSADHHRLDGVDIAPRPN